MNTTFDRKKDREERGTHAGFKGVLADFFFLSLKYLSIDYFKINPLRAKPTKWSSTLKQFVGNRGRIV